MILQTKLKGPIALLSLFPSILLTITGFNIAYAQETFSLEIAGQTYEIPYEITGGSVKSMSADPVTKTLLVTINSTSAGMLTIQLPKNVIDAGGAFSVVIDGKGNATVNESKTTGQARTLSIEFSQGSKQIEIMGTSMVPEFGVISAIVLASGVVAVLIASWKYSKFRSLQPSSR